MKIVLLQSFLSFYMMGVLWLVQRVQYPMMTGLTDDFKKWHAFHSTRITPVVGPAMVADLASAGALAFCYEIGLWLRVTVVLLTILTWLLTVALSIPLHNRLGAEGHNPHVLSRLVFTNWPRTATYTLKAVLLAVWLLLA